MPKKPNPAREARLKAARKRLYAKLVAEYGEGDADAIFNEIMRLRRAAIESIIRQRKVP